MMGVIHLGIAIAFATVLGPVFHVPVRGSLLLFFAVTTLYVASLSALGMFIATVTRNMAQTAMLGILVLAPMIFLSGMWTPPEAMPTFVRALTRLSPLHYYMDASYGILLKGASLHEIAGELWPLALFLVTAMAIGLKRYRQTLD